MTDYSTASVPQGVTFSEFLMQIIRLAWSERRIVMGTAVVGACCGILFAVTRQNEYQTEARLIPYRSGSSSSTLGGLAGIAGIRLPMGAADQTITTDVYPELVRGYDFRAAVASMPLRFQGQRESFSAMEIFRPIPVWQRVTSFRRRLTKLQGQRTAVVDSMRPVDWDSEEDLDVVKRYNRDDFIVLSELEQRISIMIDRRTSVITIKARMPDPLASADLVRLSANELMRRIIGVESRKAEEQFRFVEKQFITAKRQYDESMRALAAYSDRNRVMTTATARIDQERLERDRDVAYEMFQQLSREREQARIKMNQDTPVFTMIDAPVVPLERVSPRRSLLVVTWTALGVCIGVILTVMRRFRASRRADAQI